MRNECIDNHSIADKLDIVLIQFAYNTYHIFLQSIVDKYYRTVP
jgi:hypothetical protein